MLKYQIKRYSRNLNYYTRYRRDAFAIARGVFPESPLQMWNLPELPSENEINNRKIRKRSAESNNSGEDKNKEKIRNKIANKIRPEKEPKPTTTKVLSSLETMLQLLFDTISVYEFDNDETSEFTDESNYMINIIKSDM